MRFRPSTQAANLVVRINLDIVATSTDGSVLRQLEHASYLPHNVWVNGSIAETAVSTGGRSLNIDTSYGSRLSQICLRMVYRA